MRISDHPRACGENFPHLLTLHHNLGSPPRMRGKLVPDPHTISRTRITPAHAGKTAAYSGTYSSFPDHPRACGENFASLIGAAGPDGSPPRMRGKRVPTATAPHAARITPAHAGKTLRKWRISVVDPSPQPQSSLTSRKADASSGSQRAPCAAPV